MTQRNVRGCYLNFEHDRAADWDWLAKWQPNVIRYMGPGNISDANSFDVNRVRRIHETCPAATILLRCWDVDDRNFEAHANMVSNPRAEAERQVDWWAKVFDRAETIGVPRQSLMAGLNNETGPEKDASLYAYTERALELGTQKAVRLGVFVFSVGRPSLPGESQYDIATFSRLDSAILANGGAVVLHQYMQPEGMYAVWTDEEGRERKDWTYLMGRDTRWNIQSDIIIGEWSIDGILYNRHPDPKYGNSGWRNFKAEWPPSRYADEYVECVRKASTNVIGICPFLSDFSDHKWQSFDVLDAYGELLARKELCVREVAAAPTQPAIGDGPTPIEPPQPTRVPVLTHPIAEPSRRVISQTFGSNPQDYARFGLAGHNGVDFAVPEGTPVLAVDDGEVIEAQVDEDGYGKYVKLKHEWGESLYAHLSYRKLLDGRIKRGGLLGRSGNTGNSTSAHLHFALRILPYARGFPYDGFSDPLTYLTDTTILAPLDDEHRLEAEDKRENRERSITFLLNEEGGFQDHDWDDGNWTGGAQGKGEKKGTNFGISAASYPNLDIRNITRQQAIDIYQRDYWATSGAAALRWPLCLLVLDTAVLHGVGTAKAWVADVGPNPYLFAHKRLTTYTKSSKWPVAGAGWVNRTARLLAAMGGG